MELFWPLVLSSVAGLSTMLGTIFIFLKIKRINEFITFSISLSLSVMIMVSIFDLIPASLKGLSSFNMLNSILLFIVFFAIGMILVNIVSKLVEKGKGSKLYTLGILSFIALILHNLPEGILTFMSTYHDFNLGLSLCFAITLHNIPEGISIAVPIYYSTGSKKKAILTTLYSALAEPLGAVLAFLILKNFITDELISFILIMVAGIMITLSIEKMLPEASSYQNKKYQLIGMLIGIIIVILSLIL